MYSIYCKFYVNKDVNKDAIEGSCCNSPDFYRFHARKKPMPRGTGFFVRI